MTLRVRNFLVRPFGLITDEEDIGVKNAPASFLTTMPTALETSDTLETGITDKHLTFTLKVTTKSGQATVQTRIWFHSLFGRIYLYSVLPGHKLIVGKMVRSLQEIR